MINRIAEIYQNFINSEEYEKKARELDFDISWLKDKISHEEMLKLEETVSSYSTCNGKALFESGFCFAWELSQQCEESLKHD